MKKLSLYIFLLLGFSGCRKELFYNHIIKDGGIEVLVDWSLYPTDGSQLPFGVKAVVMQQPNDVLVQTFNFPTEGGSRAVVGGTYHILLFNNDAELVFTRGLDHWQTAEAYTATKHHTPYTSAPMNIPQGTKSQARDGIGSADLFLTTSAESVEVKSGDNVALTQVKMTPESVVKPIQLIVPIVGMKNISEARGFLSGVIPSMFLAKRQLSTESTLLLFDYSRSIGGSELINKSMVFGLAPSERYTLGVELLLIDASVLYYEFDVSDQITEDLRIKGGEIRCPITIVVPDIDVPSGGGGFKPGIGNWVDQDVEVVI